MYEGNVGGTPASTSTASAVMLDHVASAPVPLFASVLATYSGSWLTEAAEELGRQHDKGRSALLVNLASAPVDVQRQQMRQWSSSLTTGAETGGDPWEGLPACIAIHIFGLLPVPQRLRCREVCTLWRSLLATPHAWVHVDVSAAATGIVAVRDCNGVPEAKSLALLKVASRAAHGQAQTLDVSGAFQSLTNPVSTALIQIVRDNAASLRTVRITGFHRDFGLDVCGLHVGLIPDSRLIHHPGFEPYLSVAAILAAAPNLSALEVQVGSWMAAAELQAVLGMSSDAETRRRFAPVRVCALSVYVGSWGSRDPAEDIALANAFLAFAPAHPWLRRVRLECCYESVLSPGLLSPIIQGVGAMAGRLEEIDMDGLPHVPEWLPVLTRALRSGVLRELYSIGGFMGLNHVPPAMPVGVVAQFCDALRESCVERLTLWSLLDEWQDAASFGSVLCALAGNRTLRVLKMRHNNLRAWPAAREQLASSLAGILAANSPDLASLNISDNSLGPDELAPVFRALASNMHIRELICSQGSYGEPALSEAFVREFVLPAVRACGSLRTLDYDWDDYEEAEQIRAILEERTTAG